MSAEKEIVELPRNEPPALKVGATPMEMLASAIERGMSPEVIGQLMALEERWTANKAKHAFNNAVADAKAALKPVVKNRTGHNSKRYADFAAYATAVDPIIASHGLTYRFRTTQDDKIKVACILSHRDGHSEENSLSGPADTSGNKNAIQAIGSTLTYLQRYTLTQALGLAATEDDDGKAAGIGETITDEQAATLQGLLMEHDIPLAKFFKVLGIDKLADLPASRFGEAEQTINDAIAIRAQKKREKEPA